MSDHTTAPASVAEVIERIREIQPLLREQAPIGDAERCATPVAMEAIRKTGALRVGVPKRLGGLEGSTQDMLDVSAAIGYADGGAAWVTTLANVCGWLASLFPLQVQEEIWGSDPDTVVTGVLAPTSQAQRVEGGYRVTGKWGYNSGSYQASWAGVGIPIVNDEGQLVNQGLVVIPRSDYEIEDTWHVVGMRGSASNTIVVNDVFVPDHRVMLMSDAIPGNYLNEKLAEEPAHRTAFVPVLALVLIGTQLGLARAAFDYVIERTHTKPISYSFFERAADSTGVQIELARIAQTIDMAELLARRAAGSIDDAAAAGTYPDVQERARTRADTGTVAELVLDAINRLISLHGAGTFAEASPLQRIWRDANTAARHAVVNPLISLETYGKTLVGATNHVTPLI